MGVPVAVRIYLDQKDLSRMAKGIVGHTQCTEDAALFGLMKKHVDQDRVRVYFSWCHVVEAFRYGEGKLDLLKPYCHVVDALCRGHCLRPSKAIDEAEVREWAYQEQQRQIPGNQFSPYGKHSEVFGWTLADHEEKFKFLPKVRKDLLAAAQRYSEPARKRAMKQIRSRDFMKRTILGLDDEGFQALNAYMPIFGFSRREWADLLCGKPPRRKEVLNKGLQRLTTMKGLVQASSQFPEFKEMGSKMDPTAAVLVQMLRTAQAFDVVDPPAHTEELSRSFVRQFRPVLLEAAKGNLAEAELMASHLHETRFECVPSIGSSIKIVEAFFRRHDAPSKAQRRPRPSDVMDLNHARYLPYVDLFSCDGFFFDILRGWPNKAIARDAKTIANSLEELLAGSPPTES